MKTEEEHMGSSIPRRVVAAAVALFLAGITWYHCGGPPCSHDMDGMSDFSGDRIYGF